MDDARLQTIWRQRQLPEPAAHLGRTLSILVGDTLARKVRQVGQLGKIWDEVVPAEIAEHTALEGFSRGVLTVLVDSAAHRFQLQTLLAGGLSKVIQRKFSGAIRKIRLLPGQFYSVDPTGRPRYEF